MDDRDALARSLFTIRPSHRWETWDETSEGQRQWCRDKADQLIAQGWRRVGEGDVVVSREDAYRMVAYWDRQQDGIDTPLDETFRAFLRLTHTLAGTASRVRAALTPDGGEG